MKFSFAILLFSQALFAEEICVSGFSPKIKKGEVKISFPCEAFDQPASVESEKITFFERKNNPSENDLIIRHRSSKKEKDFTLKFRKPPGSPLSVDQDLYNTLKMKDDLKEVNFKCEADVTYNPQGNKSNESCSLATPTDFYTPDHDVFMKMVNKTVPTNRDDLIPYEIQSVSWKVSHPDFTKGISIEKWELTNSKGEKLCILEASAKFEIAKGSSDSLEVTFNRSMNTLKAAFPDLTPSSLQGNKTARALGFLRPKY